MFSIRKKENVAVGFRVILPNYTRFLGFCTVAGGIYMREFEIRLNSVADVQEFVDLATTRPFAVTIHDASNKINGSSFMEMFCLDFSRPVRVVCDCSEEELQQFRADAGRFLAY